MLFIRLTRTFKTASKVLRALPLILSGLLFVTAPRGALFAEEKTALSFQEKEVSGISGEVIPGPESPGITDKKEADRKKLGYRLGIEDATSYGKVRASNVKIGADYKVSENATVGVEASRKIYDSQDAAAWGSSVEDEHTAQAKYKLSF